MANTKNLDPKRWVYVFKGIQVQGFHNGTYIEVIRTAPTFSTDVGAEGDVVRVRSHDKRVTVRCTLQASSPTNDLLTAIALAGEEGTTVDGDMGSGMLKDLNGTTTLVGQSGWITKMPDVNQATTHLPRVWEFEFAEMEMFVGGAIR